MGLVLDLIILCFSAWRLTSILQREYVAGAFRKLFGEKLDTSLGVYTYPDTFLGHLIQCFWCVSVWASLACYFVYLIDVRLLIPFAVSTVVIFMDKGLK